ncbi:MAG: bifunctional folylpolyglutamate synthase/dihydrofolate synthase [Lachnospiraceae bacterium]|nr:bifunctional folylpolyglutamate synthase/dihydrofolate synthase [Lachnospiraceae bacterium]
MTSYEEAVKYIEEIPKFAGKNTVEDTGRMCALLTENVWKSRIIHVAGTNGKGSVCAYLRSILMEGGRSTGMFISPHLETIRERISVDGEMITEEDFVRIFTLVRETAQSSAGYGLSHPSYFEFLFLMAMRYFWERKPDYIVLETGMGGRLDATNSVQDPAVCVITQIGYDHMQYLGDTLEQIAAEKAGIIKENVPVVFADERAEVTGILAEYAGKKKSPAVLLKKDQILNVNIKNKTIDFSLHTGYYNYDSLSLNTSALYQVENSSLAVLAAQELRDDRITPDVIRRGVWAARWQGRMEEAMPGVFLDGAHNEDGIRAFLRTAAQDGCAGRRVLLFGVVADKRYEKMIQMIEDSGLFAQAVVTVLETDRSASIDELKRIWEKRGKIRCSFHEDAGEALKRLLRDKTSEDTAYVVGSLYLIGQVKSLMRRMQDD